MTAMKIKLTATLIIDKKTPLVTFFKLPILPFCDISPVKKRKKKNLTNKQKLKDQKFNPIQWN